MTMLRDSMLLVNIQLAIMGIVLVAGLFYLWRMICRVERKVDDFIAEMEEVRNCATVAGASGADEMIMGGTDEAEDFMNEVFGCPAKAFVITQPQPSFAQATTVQIEEEDVATTPAPPASCAMSEADTTASHSTTSKSKLKRMSAESLRDVCKEKGLATEGTKAVLLERILETMDGGDLDE